MNDPQDPLDLSMLAERYGLDSAAVTGLQAFGWMLAHDELAPTTVRDTERVRDDHLADALVALELDQIRDARLIADLGAGAGVPGLPLAVALPHAEFVLIDGSSRKCEFMRRAADALRLDNVTVLHERAETWKAGIGRCDVVTARAVAALDVVEEYAAPLLRMGGSLVVWRGKRDFKAEADGVEAARILGLTEAEPRRVAPYPGAANRHLHIYQKSSRTPGRFPRRDGMARKKPLGAS